MGDLIQVVEGEPRASSRRMAEALGVQHKSLMEMVTAYEADFAKLGRVAFETETLQTPGGPQKSRTAYLNEDQCYLLLTYARNTLEARSLKLGLVQEFARLRRQATPLALPQDYLSALKALVSAEESRLALEAQVQAQQPAVEFVERFVQADGLFGIREAARVLDIPQNQFVQRCLERGVLFREAGSLQPYAQHQRAGYFAVKAGTNPAGTHAFKQTRFTAAGLEWVRRKVA